MKHIAKFSKGKALKRESEDYIEPPAEIKTRRKSSVWAKLVNSDKEQTDPAINEPPRLVPKPKKKWL